jgi:D-tyrosyl-tRNA(Tyr) deacylase
MDRYGSEIMRAVLQRVSEAEVSVDGRVIGSIGRGFVVLLGIAKDDTEKDAAYIADKTLGLRVFADEAGKMNLALKQVGGELLVVSQFTLLADTESGRRPSFIRAAPPEDAKRLYEHFLSLVRNGGVKVETGEFGAMMAVSLINDGPVTIVLDSRKPNPFPYGKGNRKKKNVSRG